MKRAAEGNEEDEPPNKEKKKDKKAKKDKKEKDKKNKEKSAKDDGEPGVEINADEPPAKLQKLETEVPVASASTEDRFPDDDMPLACMIPEWSAQGAEESVGVPVVLPVEATQSEDEAKDAENVWDMFKDDDMPLAAMLPSMHSEDEAAGEAAADPFAESAKADQPEEPAVSDPLPTEPAETLQQESGHAESQMENAAAGSTDRWTSGDQVETEGAGDAEPNAHMEVERSRDVPIAVGGLQPGVLVEARFGNSMFDATVLEVSETTVKLRWNFDDSEADVDRSEVVLKPTPDFTGVNVGVKLKAKFGNSMFDAALLEIGVTTVKVKWDHDGSEQEVVKQNVRLPEGKPKPAEPVMEPGAPCESKFGNSMFDAEVVEVKGGVVKIKWGFDGSEVEVNRDAVILKAAPDLSGVEVGSSLQAKFGNAFFDATVVELGTKTVKVKWGFDGSEQEVIVQNIKVKDPEPEVDPIQALKDEFKTIKLKGQRDDWYFESNPRATDDCEGMGISVTALISTANIGKIVGKNGSMMKTMAKAFGCEIGVAGGHVISLGTRAQRDCASAVAAIIEKQNRGTTHWSDVCPVLLGICTRVPIPDNGMVKAITGTSRATLCELELETGVVCTFSTVPPAPTPHAEFDVTEGLLVEGRYGGSSGRWHPCEVVQLNDDGSVKVKWTYDQTDADVPRIDVREKLEGEALEERTRLERESQGQLNILILSTSPRNRIDAALRVMAIMEAFAPGTAPAPDLFENIDVQGRTSFGLDVISLDGDRAALCAGASHAKRRKRLSAAVGCVLDVVASSLYVAGSEAERVQADAFFPWTLMTELSLSEAEVARGDVLTVKVSVDKRKNLTEEVVDGIAEETKTLILCEVDDVTEFRIAICGGRESDRTSAAEKLKTASETSPSAATWSGSDAKWSAAAQSWEKPKASWNEKREDRPSWKSKDERPSWEAADKWKDSKATWAAKEEKSAWNAAPKDEWKSADKWKDAKAQAWEAPSAASWKEEPKTEQVEVAASGWQDWREASAPAPVQVQPQVVHQVVQQAPVAFQPQMVQHQPMYLQPVQMQPLLQADPRVVLGQVQMPRTLQEWTDVQDVVFAGWPQLPPGWVRIWSKSQNSEYYLRLADMFSTFEPSEVR